MIRVSTKRILSIGLAVLFLIGALVVYSTIIRGTAKSIDEQRAIVASKQNLYDNQNNAVEQVQKLIAQFKGLKVLQDAISLAVPSGEETIGALREIEAIARQSNVNVSGVGFEAIVPKASTKSFIKKLGILNITLTLSGGYNDLKRFLQLLETSVRVANVNSFKFKPGVPERGRTGPVFDSLNISVEMYYQQE
ncbi:type 4a pilus biogenesis protein PilO [Candidatus Jorgensenbacteria bacterium]|nr:type 4a pilus biogenesis protein PilO [Candidatus Jorgensenbacteria bacterium]